MDGRIAIAAPRPRRAWRSIGAVLAGLVTCAAPAHGTDELLRALGVFPSMDVRMGDGLFLLALGYRTLFTVLGGWVVARLSPHAPMRHVMIAAYIGLALSLVGVTVSLMMPELGPLWYPVGIAALAIPATRLGGYLHRAHADTEP